MHVVVVGVYENFESREMMSFMLLYWKTLERPGADFHEFFFVVKVGFFSASALLMVEAQAYILKLAVQHGLKMAMGGIGRPKEGTGF